MDELFNKDSIKVLSNDLDRRKPCGEVCFTESLFLLALFAGIKGLDDGAAL